MKAKRNLIQIWLLCAAMLPGALQAQFTFTTNVDGTLNIAKYTGPGGNVTIPDTTNGLTVTSIGGGAFQNCTSLTSVTIPDSVISILVAWDNILNAWVDGAFKGCTSLTNAIIGNGVTSIGGYAFYGCTALKSVTIGTSVKSIGYYAFGACGLTSVMIPDSVTNISDHAFYSCTTSLTNVSIGNGVISIGEFAFKGCTGLKSVTIGTNVTSIGGGAFQNCASLTSVTIPDGVTSILVAWDNILNAWVDGAFKGCTSLTNVTIGNGVTSIGSYAFYGCTALKNVTIGSNVTSIGSDAFQNCTSLTSVTIPNTVINIGGGWNTGAFQGCTSLTNAIIGNGVISIGEFAFYGCTALKSVTIGNSVTSIGGGAFQGCTSLTSVTIPDSVTNILVAWDNILNAWVDGAFKGCTSLTNVTIGNGVTSIGGYAFQNCTNLVGIFFKGNAPNLGSSVFSGDTKATVYYVLGTTGWPIPPATFGGLPTAVWMATLIVTPVTTTSYGSLLVSNTADRTFTVSNVGTSSVPVTVNVPSPFSVVGSSNYTLAPGQVTNTTIRFAPTAAGNNSAYVTFTGGGSQTRQVTGSAYTDPTATTGSIVGQVTRASDGSPMNAVTISVVGPNGTLSPLAVTGVSGSQAGGYSISGLRPGAYSVTAMPPIIGLLAVVTTNSIAVAAGQTTTVNIALPSGNQPPTPTPQNTPVVLVRGFGKDTEWANDDSNSWHEIRSALVAKGFTNVWDCNQPEAGIITSLGTTGHFINGELSIDSNAASLKSYLQQKAEQYKASHNGSYPPQIHIVAHSMGGLIVRSALGNDDHFAFPNSSFQVKLGKVIMLATPHCGSPLADVLHGSSLILLVNVFTEFFGSTWDSTRDLTTSSMKCYNSCHPWPSLPLYLFSASGWNFGFLKRWYGNGALDKCSAGDPIIQGQLVLRMVSGTEEMYNDGVVTKPSANGIYWGLKFSPLPFPCPITNVVLNPVQRVTDSDLGTSVDHFFLLKDSAVINWAVNTLTNAAPTPTPLTITSSAKAHGPVKLDGGGSDQQSIPLQAFESLAGTVTNGTTVTNPVVSDASTTLTFQLMASDTNIIFRLNAPSGTLINTNTPQTNTNVQYTASAVASNFLLATYTIANPTGGVWKAVIDASSITTTQAAYSLMVFGDSNMGLIPQTASLFAQGQDAVLSCVLADLSTNPVVAVSNASIKATIRLPDGTTNSLTLFDDGWHNDGTPNDGVYAAVLTNVQQAGTYSIAYRATGTNAQGQALQRVATGTFSVSSGNGSVLGDPIYETVDTDGDGIADFLEVKSWVNPTTNGNYILAGDLVDASGTHRFSQSVAFAADGSGPTMAALIFDLAKIRAAGGLGTYHIKNLQLFEVTSNGTAWLDAYQGSSVVIIQGVEVINVGVRTNQFGFNVTGPTNLVIVVEACTNLASATWTNLQSCNLTNGSFYFSDPHWTNYPGRFYRLRSP